MGAEVGLTRRALRWTLGDTIQTTSLWLMVL